MFPLSPKNELITSFHVNMASIFPYSRAILDFHFGSLNDPKTPDNFQNCKKFLKFSNETNQMI